MADTLLIFGFWASLAVLVYTFFVYPFLIFALASVAPRRTSTKGDSLPPVSVLVPIYNEEAVLQEKLANCLELDYPKHLIEIVFASDGSTDRGVEFLRRCGDPRVHVVEYPVNRGKAVTLNDTIPGLKGDIVLLTDASGIVGPRALRGLVRHFRDARIGCVCGIYHIFKEGRTPMDSAESTYHGFEMQLRLWEGRFRTTLSGTGALCAIRKADWEPLPPGVINEDYVIPSRIAMAGGRVVYDPAAHVWDRISTSSRQVFQRRVRIAYGNWQQLGVLRGLLNPLRGYLFWVFVSHKLLRMALPFLLLALFICSWALSPWLSGLFALGGLGLLLLGLLGLLLDHRFEERNPLGFVVLVLLNCVAVLVGSYRWITGGAVRW